MGSDFFEYLGKLLSEISVIQFIIYILSIIVLISLPTFLSLLKESKIQKKLKYYHELSYKDIKLFSEQTINHINKVSEKVELMADKSTNIIDNDSIIYFIGPIYKNISLAVYKNVDLLLYDYDLKHSEAELKIIIKRDISVRFKKAHQLLGKYKLLNGHKISYYVNEKWEHWVYNSIEELLFKSDIDQINIRVHLWNLLETSLDECIDEINRKIKRDN